MKPLFKILYNKYFIASAVFVLIITIFDQNDVFTQMDRSKQLNKVKADIDYLRTKTEEMSRELDDLDRDPELVIKHTREKYHYKQKDEDVFLIIQDTVYQDTE